MVFIYLFYFQRYYFRNKIIVPNNLYPDQSRRFVGFCRDWLWFKRLQRLSVDDSGRSRVNSLRCHNNTMSTRQNKYIELEIFAGKIFNLLLLLSLVVVVVVVAAEAVVVAAVVVVVVVVVVIVVVAVAV